MMSTGEGEGEVLPGRRLADRYIVQRQVARGGMAHVYEARDERLDRPVAVKVLASPFADDPAYVGRFLDEARIAAGISHPNLAHVYDSGEDDGVHFIVLELLEGYRSLRDELAERGLLPIDEAVRIARDALAGLAPLHAHGLVHCDVKPGNVLVGRGGAKLIDFGIAQPLQRQTAEPTSIGSLHSMSPEQLRGEGLTPASDIFGVGVVLYEALTGRVPFAGETPAAVAAAQAAGPPPAPSGRVAGIPDMLDAAVLEALELDPARRFASTAAMEVALKAAVAVGQPDAAAHPQLPDDETTAFVPLAATPVPPEARRATAPPATSMTGPRPAWILTGLILLAVPLVIVLIVVGGLGASSPPADARTRTSTPRQTPTIAAGKIEVPNTIGMTEAQAEGAARASGLNWRLEWQVDPSKEPGVFDQEPPPGELVDDGARFVMYAYRTR
jgi:serine/threonine protein kinase